MSRQTIGTLSAVAVILAFLMVPGVAFANDDEATTDPVSTVISAPEVEPPADVAPPVEITEPVEPVRPVVTPEPAEPVEVTSEPAAPAPATDEPDAPSPTGYSAPAADPPDRVVAEEPAAVEPTGYETPSGGGGGGPELKRVHADSGGASASAKKGKGDGKGASCRTDVGVVPEGQNNEIHDSFGPNCGKEINSGDTVDGVTFTYTIEETPNGQVLNFTTDVPFTGSIFVKGGSIQNGGGHFQCDFVNVTSGTCHAPVNDNNGKFFNVSHVDVCVGEAPPPPGGEQPPGGDGPGGDGPGGGQQPGGGGGQQQQEEEDEQEAEEEQVEGAAPPGVTPAGVPTAAAAAPGEALPFTGFDPAWLALFGSVLLVGGVLVRRQAS